MRLKPFFCILLSILLITPTSEAFFFNPRSFFGGLFNTTGLTPPPTPSSDWGFNETSGTTIDDDKNVADMTQSGGTMNDTNLDINLLSGSNSLITPNGTYGSETDATFAFWIELDAVNNNTHFLAVGDGTGVTPGNYGFFARVETGGFRVYLSDGTGTSNVVVTVSGNVQTGTKYLVIVKYDETPGGGSEDNVLTIKYAEEGTCSFTEAENTTSRTLDTDATFELRGTGVTNLGINGKYYRGYVFSDKVTNDEEDTNICNWGSEGGSIANSSNYWNVAVVNGDSYAGVAGSPYDLDVADRFYSQLQGDLGNTWYVENRSLENGGKSVSQLTTELSGDVGDLYNDYPSYANVDYVLFVNYDSGGAADIQSHVDEIQANTDWDIFIVYGIAEIDSSTTSSIATVRSSLSADAATEGYTFIDLGADARFDSHLDTSSGDYQADAQHPSAAGMSYISTLAKAGIVSAT